MPRLTPDTWQSVRAEREAGASLSDLAARFGIDKAAVSRRAKAEQWGDGTDVAEVIRRKVNEKVNGVSTADAPKKKAEAIDAAATKVAAVVEIHKQEWVDHRDHFDSVPEDFDAGKHAKISAEMLKIRQAGERIAHGLDDGKTEGATVIIERSYGIAR